MACGWQCIGKPPEDPCMATCIAERGGVSQPCAQCYAELLACIGANCLGKCVRPESPECAACAVQNCGVAFEACSGLPSAVG